MDTFQFGASHYGPRHGSSKFPNFHDGDVEIVLSPARHLRLHSKTLCLWSDKFRDLLDEGHAAHLNSQARREGIVVRWRLELRIPQGDEAENVGRLVQRDLDHHGRWDGPVIANNDHFYQPANRVYDSWTNVLRGFYHEKPIFSETNRSDFHTVVENILSVVEVAEYLKAIKVVTKPVDNALIQFGQSLWRSIAATPCIWADLAYRIRSELLFREASVHLIGQWKQIKSQIERPEIHEIISNKAHKLNMNKMALETRITGHYPHHLRKKAPNHNVGPGGHTQRGRGMSTRAGMYGSDALGHMALGLFRHYIGQQMANDKTKHASDGGHEFYTKLGKGGTHYLDLEQINKFCGMFPMSRKGRGLFEDHLNKIKDGIKAYVAPILVHKGFVDIAADPLRYLTCEAVETDELPWTEREQDGSKRPGAEDQHLAGFGID